MRKRASFTSMKDSTSEDWQLISAEFAAYARGLPDRVIAHLRLLEGDFGGFPVDRYTHSLQTATRAMRDGREDEYVVCALLHDIGDTLATSNHPDIAAAILKPFISDANLWMVEHHAIFQGTTTSNTSGWISICANDSLDIFTTTTPQSFTIFTKARHSMRGPNLCRSASSSLWLEPYGSKGTSPVLRGLGAGNRVWQPDGSLPANNQLMFDF